MSIYGLEAEGYLGNGEFDGEFSGEWEGETGYGQDYEEEFGGYELADEFGAGAYEQEGEYGAGGYGYEWAQAPEAEGEAFLADLAQLGGEYESPLDEIEEMELAAQLLEVRDEAELEQFLGGLIKTVARGAGGFLKSPTGKALGGILKNVTKAALPVVGGAIGSVVAPGIGTAVGSKLGSLASRLFEVELERMEPEDQEFEVARRVVRLSATSARNAALARRRANPRAVARGAVLAASRRHAPGVYRRYRAFARPAPWYWPRPVPVYAPPPPPLLEPSPAAAPPPPAAGPEPGQPPADEPGGGEEPAGEPAGELDGEGWYGRRGQGSSGRGGNGDRGGNGGGRARSGRWVRRGRRLIVLGI